MTEIPERMEREMFELRNQMAPDVRDLKQHVNPQAVGKKFKNRAQSMIVSYGRGFLGSAKQQANKAQEAGQKKDPSALTDAVKSDPRPMIVLAVVLAFVIFLILAAGGKAASDD